MMVQNYSGMSPADKIRVTEIMHGTGSKQHLKAIARWAEPTTTTKRKRP